MGGKRNILIALDDSEASLKAVKYVADLIGGVADLSIYLVHVLPPLPPDLLEFGGAEDPHQEARMESRLHQEQAVWAKEECDKVRPLFQRAKDILLRAGVKKEAIQPHHCLSVNRWELARNIMEAAEARNCETIVVGRRAFHGLHKLLGHHVSDHLLRKCEGLTIWVVE